MTSVKMVATRRAVLAQLASLPVVWSLPNVALGATAKRRRLVLVEMKGGNDGLNTFPPLSDAAYRELRPTLALPNRQILPLGEGRGMHKAFEALNPYWERGQMGIINGIGSAKPNLSHFDMGAQWSTGDVNGTTGDPGWIGRLIAEHGIQPSSGLGAHTVGIGANVAPISAPGVRTIQLAPYPSSIENSLMDSSAEADAERSGAARHLAQVLTDLRKTGEVYADVELDTANVDWPQNSLAAPFQQALKLIKADQGLSVIKLTAGGFDTHAHQVSRKHGEDGSHFRMLKRLGDSIAAMALSLERLGLWDDVVIATYSEFGRRVLENNGHGTEHGAANSLFVLGGGVRGGFYGEPPSLRDLDENGNLRMNVDFNEYYAALGSRVLGLGAAAGLPLL